MFQLWDEKILRATSVNFIPIVWKNRPGTGPEDPKDGRPGMHVTEWELLEWGPVGIPDNPYAVAKVLHRGRLDGRAIEEPLLRMLKRFAPERRAYTTGLEAMPTAPATTAAKPVSKTVADQDANARTDEELKDMAEDSETDKLDPKDTERKSADAKPAGKPEDAPKPSDAGPRDDVDNKDPDDEDGEDGDGADFVPAGSKALHAMHKCLSSASRKCMKAAGKIEQPEVNEHLKSLGEALNGHVSEISDCHAKCYKNLEGPGDETEDEGGESDTMSKFFADSMNDRLQLKGLAFELRSFGSAKNLTVSQKSKAEALGERLTKLLDKATQGAKPITKSAPAAKPVEGDDPTVVKALTEVGDVFRGINKALGDAMPHKKPAA